MPLDPLTCSKCGSNDFKEVKPNIYFCNNCDSLFKHIDPTKITASPAFCECGNLVQVQCKTCGRGICQLCDLATKRYVSYVFLEPTDDPWIPTVGFGQPWRISDGRLALDVRQMMTALGSTPQHICPTCIRGAVPRAAEMISQGLICAHAGCSEVSNLKKCICCGYHYCQSKVGSSWDRWPSFGPHSLEGRPKWHAKGWYGFPEIVAKGSHGEDPICHWNEHGHQVHFDIEELLWFPGIRDTLGHTVKYVIAKNLRLPDGLCADCAGAEWETRVANIILSQDVKDLVGSVIPENEPEQSFKRLSRSRDLRRYTEWRQRRELQSDRLWEEVQAMLDHSIDSGCQRPAYVDDREHTPARAL